MLVDDEYLERFWTLFEAYLAFQETGKRGLVPCKEAACRYVILGVQSASSSSNLIEQLKKMWENCPNALQAYFKLKDDKIKVTNKSDKLQQLDKLPKLDAEVSKVVSGRDSLSAGGHLFVASPPSAALSFDAEQLVATIERRVVSPMEHRILGEVGQRVVVAFDQRGQISVTPRGGGMPRPMPAAHDLTSRLSELAALHRDGALDVDEFREAKKLVLHQAHAEVEGRGCCEWLFGRRQRSLASSASPLQGENAPAAHPHGRGGKRADGSAAAAEEMATLISETSRDPAQSQSGGRSAQSISITAQL